MVVLSLSPDRHWRHPCVNHTTKATKFWYRGGRHCTAIPVVERLCGAWPAQGGCMGRGSGQSLFSAFPQVGGLHHRYERRAASTVAGDRTCTPVSAWRVVAVYNCVARITSTHNPCMLPPCMLPNSQLWPIFSST